MGAVVDLGYTKSKPQTEIPVLGLRSDEKLRGVPDIKKVQAKLATQCLAVSISSVSALKATLDKARMLYSIVIRPVMTVLPRVLTDSKKTQAEQFDVMQNNYLHRVLAAC